MTSTATLTLSQKLDTQLDQLILSVRERQRYEVARIWRTHGHQGMADREMWFWDRHLAAITPAKRNLTAAGADPAPALDRAIWHAQRVIEAAVGDLAAADPMETAAEEAAD